jgi:hypothetical protein
MSFGLLLDGGTIVDYPGRTAVMMAMDCRKDAKAVLNFVRGSVVAYKGGPNGYCRAKAIAERLQIDMR